MADSARPYSQHINFDKTLAGILFLGCSGWTPIRSTPEWNAALRRAAPVTLVTVIVVMAASVAIGYVRFDPRWSAIFPVWAAINLLTTCVSEEAFFRGLIQRERPVRAGPGRSDRGKRPRIAVALSARLFGLAHAAGGWQYVVVASLAGAGYAVRFSADGAPGDGDPYPLRGERRPFPALYLPCASVAIRKGRSLVRGANGPAILAVPRSRASKCRTTVESIDIGLTTAPGGWEPGWPRLGRLDYP